MKRKYKNLINIIVCEWIIVFILSELNIRVNSWTGNAVGILIFLFPLLMLLYLVKNDNEISAKNRMIVKIVFYFIIVCYMLGGIGEAVELMIDI